MAGLLHFTDKMLNFKHRTKNRRIMQDDTLVVLAEDNTITEAEIAKSMRNEYMSAIYPIGTMPAQIVVREEDYEKAKAMLHHR